MHHVILLVDDDSRMLTAMARTLKQKLGVDVLPLTSVGEASELIAAFPCVDGHGLLSALLTNYCLDDGTAADVLRSWIRAGYDEHQSVVWSGDASNASRRLNRRVWVKSSPEIVIAEIQRITERIR